MARKPIPKKIRFEVLKRDSFKCQYCGMSAPDCMLVIDHIQPVKNGGTNDILNLITACESCNAGKGARLLSDTSVVSKQRKQLDQSQEKIEQLEMLFNWKKSLLQETDVAVQGISIYWRDLLDGQYHLNRNGEKFIQSLLKKYSPGLIMDCMDESVTNNVKTDKDGKITKQSAETAWQCVEKYCSIAESDKNNPFLKDALYIRGIIRNKFDPSRSDLNSILSDILNKLESGGTAEKLKISAKKTTSLSAWISELNK